jgi:hypothetical protein
MLPAKGRPALPAYCKGEAAERWCSDAMEFSCYSIVSLYRHSSIHITNLKEDGNSESVYEYVLSSDTGAAEKGLPRRLLILKRNLKFQICMLV